MALALIFFSHEARHGFRAERIVETAAGLARRLFFATLRLRKQHGEPELHLTLVGRSWNALGNTLPIRKVECFDLLRRTTRPQHKRNAKGARHKTLKDVT